MKTVIKGVKAAIPGTPTVNGRAEGGMGLRVFRNSGEIQDHRMVNYGMTVDSFKDLVVRWIWQQLVAERHRWLNRVWFKLPWGLRNKYWAVAMPICRRSRWIHERTSGPVLSAIVRSYFRLKGLYVFWREERKKK